MVQFRFNLATVLLLWKTNIANFTVNVQESSDPGHPDDCMLVTNNNDDGCKVEHIAKRCRSNNDFDQPHKRNYATLIGVIISLMCPDALFEGIYNYLKMIKDDEFLK
jgi:hypothetical protein